MHAIDSRISEYALKLGGAESSRTKKRVLQKLGKLKKERTALQAGAGVGAAKRKTGEESGAGGGDSDGDDGDDPVNKRSRRDDVIGGVPAPLPATRKEIKVKVKLLNRELAQLAMKKQLKLSLKRLRQAVSKGCEPLFDVHTFTNLINCYVRCGDNAGASSVLQEMRRLQIAPNVVTYTIILKGLCGSGQSAAAARLLADNSWQPNLRAINTFLRGCVRSGDVSLAEQAFSRYFKQGGGSSALAADITSYAYTCKLLCQSMQVGGAAKMVEAAEALLASGPDHGENDLLSLAGMHADVATALSLLNKGAGWSAHLDSARDLLQRSSGCRLHKSMLKKMNSGGDGDGDGDDKGRGDSSSMQLFYQHQKNELEIDVELLASQNSKRDECGAATVAMRLSRVFCFPSREEGDSDSDGDGDAFERTASALTDSLVSRFGLHNVARLAAGQASKAAVDPDALARSTVRALIASLDGSSPRGTLRLGPDVKLELCSGNGDWLVAQALAEPACTWVGLELRCDRVYRTFVRNCLLNRKDNLVCIGGDAGLIVRQHLTPESLSAVFINHPEPPERTGGDADSQGGHLLTVAFFADLQTVLKKGSGVSIVTDNLPYAKSLLLILAQLAAREQPMFRSKSSDALADSCTLEESAGEGSARLELWRLHNSGALTALGHPSTSSSYFDRLWTMGKKKRRWALCVKKV